MNDKVISLSEKRAQKKLDIEKQAQPSGEIVKLWRLSLAMDDLIKSGVLNDKLPPDEISTILANRLGTLISCCENPHELAKFCIEIIERINSDDIHGKGA